MEALLAGTPVVVPFPDGFQELRAMPGDPEGAQFFGFQSPGATCMVTVTPLAREDLWPLDTDIVARSLLSSLPANAALLEIVAEAPEEGVPFIAALVKSMETDAAGSLAPGTLQYRLTAMLDVNDSPRLFEAFLSEAGMTGMRDSMVFNLYQNANAPDRDRDFPGITGEPWLRNPFTGKTDGYQMNLGEDPAFDADFPGHPLTLARSLVNDSLKGMRHQG